MKRILSVSLLLLLYPFTGFSSEEHILVDPQSMEISSEDGWGRKGNKIIVKKDGEIIVRASAKVDYEEVVLVRDYLRLMVESARKHNPNRLSVSTDDLSSLLEYPEDDRDPYLQAFTGSNVYIFMDLFGLDGFIENYNLGLPFINHEEIRVEAESDGLRLYVNNQAKLFFPMNGDEARDNSILINLKLVNFDSETEFLVLNLKKYDFLENNAEDILRIKKKNIYDL